MSMRRSARWGLGIVGGAGLAIAAALAMWTTSSDEPGRPSAAVASNGPTASSRPIGEEVGHATRPGRSMSGRTAALAEGRVEALAEVEAAIAAPPDDPAGDATEDAPATMTDAMVEAWIADLNGLAVGFGHFDAPSRMRIISLVGDAQRRLAAKPAPERWPEVLSPTAELLLTAMADRSPAVRAEAVEVIGEAWNWQPGRTAWPDQERTLALWKQRFHAPLVRLLRDPEPAVRLATVIAMGKLPIDAMARPAVALLSDEVPAVRLQVLNSFAHRRELLTEDDILPRLYDPEPAVGMASHLVLRARGLSDELIGLAKLLYHPRAELRASAIPMLQDRTDIDTVVWLLRLSHDSDEMVRTKALEALAASKSPDARERLAEMAESDPSDSIRQTARRLLGDITASLPPLPGSPSFLPRAN